jgi:hypothetical protein
MSNNKNIIRRKCPRCKVLLKRGIALIPTYGGKPDFIGSKEVVTVSMVGCGKVVNCLKCPKCGYSVNK